MNRSRVPGSDDDTVVLDERTTRRSLRRKVTTQPDSAPERDVVTALIPQGHEVAVESFRSNLSPRAK
jgi:hypothetical protein